MGQPAGSDSGTPQSGGRTRGTETSQYPEEKNTKVIAQVVARERAPAQTGNVTASAGVVGPSAKGTVKVRRTIWKGWPERVKAPYPKTEDGRETAPE